MEEKKKKTTTKKNDGSKAKKTSSTKKTIKKAEPKKTSTRKTTTKTTKKVTKKVAKKDSNELKSEKIEPVLESTESEIPVVEEIVEETTTTETPSEPVIEQNVETSTISNNEPKKKRGHPILAALIVILLLIVSAVGYLFFSANNINAIADKFDDIDVLKATVIDPNMEISKNEATIKVIEKVVSEMNVDFKSGDVVLKAPKSVIYNIADLDTINNAIKDYGFTIEQFGFSVNPEKSEIDGYAAAKKSIIKAGIHAVLGYEFTENEIVLTIKDVEIGTLPKFLYEKFIPVGKEIGRFDISKVQIANDFDLKIFSPNKIKEIGYENNAVSMKYNFSDLVNDVMGDLFATKTNDGQSKFDSIIGSLLDAVGLEGINLEDLAGLIQFFFPQK